MSIGKRVKRARERAEVSRETAAGEMGTTVQSLVNKEGDVTQFTARELEIMARVCGVEVQAFFEASRAGSARERR